MCVNNRQRQITEPSITDGKGVQHPDMGELCEAILLVGVYDLPTWEKYSLNWASGKGYVTIYIISLSTFSLLYFTDGEDEKYVMANRSRSWHIEKYIVSFSIFTHLWVYGRPNYEINNEIILLQGWSMVSPRRRICVNTSFIFWTSHLAIENDNFHK